MSMCCPIQYVMIHTIHMCASYNSYMSNTYLQYNTFCTRFDMYRILYDTNNYASDFLFMIMVQVDCAIFWIVCIHIYLQFYKLVQQTLKY